MEPDVKQDDEALKPYPQLPKFIYAIVSDGGPLGEPGVYAEVEYSDFDDGDVVGVYELREVRKKKITHSLE